ncbi:MAG: VOC family protein [Gemmiger sp.]|nr:VOC family protein [Gemmiger sp.]
MCENILGTDAICQVGLLVHDVAATGKRFADFFGVEVPPIIHSGEPARVQGSYQGTPSDATCLMMFFDMGGLQLELIQPDDKPSVWHDDLAARGEGLHHVAFQVKKSKDCAARLAAAGYPVRMAGDYGDNSGCFHYIDTRDALKMTIELLESYEK